MSIYIKRVPLKTNENLLIDYWNKNIPDWKIKSNDCLKYLKEALNHMWLYIAYNVNKCSGLLVNEEDDNNAIWLFHVLPQMRRMGIGSELFNAALSNVNGTWSAGQGKGYWWQGVPVGYGDKFLEKRGFEWSWTSIDMLLRLEDWNYKTESNKYVRKINKYETAQLLDMLKNEPDLSNWVPFYKTMIENNRYEQIFVAYIDNKIVGCVMLLDEDEIRWKMNFKGKTGGIGCLGVMEKYREKGIGTSLAVAVTNELKHQGYDQSYIGYTWLENWYGKLGYRTVYRFKMGHMSK